MKEISLYPYQVPHAAALYDALSNHDGVLDASDTGTGKTYTAVAVVSQMRPPAVLVVCPKASIPMWRELVPAGWDIINYEKLTRSKKSPYGSWQMYRKQKSHWTWALPKGSVTIFDECHAAKGVNTLNNKVLAATRSCKVKALCLSATAASSPLEMKALGYVLRLHDYNRGFWCWSLKMGARKMWHGGLEFDREKNQDKMEELHRMIFPAKGSRMRIDLIEDFPETVIVPELVDVGKDIEAEIDKAVALAWKEKLAKALLDDEYRAKARKDLEALGSRPDEPSVSEYIEETFELNPLEILTIERLISESRKIPILTEMIQDGLDEGLAVAVFVNFDDTLQTLVSHFGASEICGNQTAAQRESDIADFQSNKNPVIVANIKAGGVSVSLHDVHHQRRRMSIICPTYSAQQLRQVLGRVRRNGGTHTVQKIVFAAGTREEQARKAVQSKLDCLDLLNDGEIRGGL